MVPGISMTFGDSPIVRTGVVPNDEGVFLDLLGDEADQIFADNAHQGVP